MRRLIPLVLLLAAMVANADFVAAAFGLDYHPVNNALKSVGFGRR